MLLRLARDTITASVSGCEPVTVIGDDRVFRRPSAVFVTLWKRIPGEEPTAALRGCIGQVKPQFELGHAVRFAALGAALRDPRFPPVQIDELPHILIEIAILSPLMPVLALEEVIIGRDGLVIEDGPYRGLLLPKVAPRLGWSREQLLQHVCLKAGLAETAWPERGRLFRFQTFEIRDDAV